MESNGKESLVVSVCPISRFGNYLVTASSTNNREPENHLTIYKFDPQNGEEPLRVLSTVKVSVVFSAIAWTKFGEETKEHEYGFIVGGHEDGSVSLWEASSIINSKESKKINFGLLQSKKFHSSRVSSLKFNQKPSIFASGSREIVVISIEKNLTLESPVKCPSQDGAEITSLSWNDKVPHILASATTTGTTYIWEMKKTEVFLRIVDQGILGDGSEEEVHREETVTKILWCSDGVQIVIAYDHPEYNFLTQYHMKQPGAPTAEYHGGHREPICDMTKNPNDTNFMLSLGKDNTVTLWSLRTQRPLVHLPMTDKVTSIVWLNKTPDVFVAVNENGSITHHQVNFSSDNFNKGENVDIPPKWLVKKSGIAFAFGGKFATFSEKTASNVALHSLPNNLELSTKMKAFIEKSEKTGIESSLVLDDKITSMKESVKDKNSLLFWVALKCVNNEDYEELFSYMGFEKSKLQSEVYAYIGKKVEKTQKKERQRVVVNANINDEAEEFWNKAATTKEEEQPKTSAGKSSEVVHEKPMTITESVTKNINWNLGAEKLIKQSLLIGDLESAVDVALKCGREAEALLIASAGDKNLFNKAKASFFNKNKDLFIKNIFSSIINNDFESLFEYNVLKDWKEYILYAKTYLQPNEFITFANNLGDRLRSNPDIYMALVCYVLGRNYDRCIDLLHTNYTKETEKLGKNESKIFLQNLFEHVISLKNVLRGGSDVLTDKIISDYCEVLINEGLLIEALTYLSKIKNSNSRILTLYDRLVNHCEANHKFGKMQSPFNVIVVKPKLEKTVNKGKAVNNMNSNNSMSNMNSTQNKMPVTKTNKDIFGEEITNEKKSPFDKMPSMGGMGSSNTVAKPAMPNLINQNVPRPNLNRNVLNENKPATETRNEGLNNFGGSNNAGSNLSGNMINPNIRKPIIAKPLNPPVLNKRNTEPEETSTSGGIQPLNSNIQKPPAKFAPNKPVNPTPFQPKIDSNTNPTGRQSQSNTSPISSHSGNQNVQPMTMEEELIHSSFEKFVEMYNNTYPDENKQKDFYGRVSALLTKLKNHEIKTNLLKLLIDFINLYQSDASTADLKKNQLKIQANGWDQNKTWMSCIEKIVNMPRDK